MAAVLYTYTPVFHNVWPAGHIRPTTSHLVAWDVQQDKGLFKKFRVSQHWH